MLEDEVCQMAAHGHVGLLGLPAHGGHGDHVIEPRGGLTSLFRAIFVGDCGRVYESLVDAFGLQHCKRLADWCALGQERLNMFA